MAAPVSSHELSIPSMSIINIPDCLYHQYRSIPPLLCFKFLQENGFQFLEVLLIGRGFDLIRPHDQGIFLVVAIITMTQTCFPESVLTIKILRTVVGDSNFKGNPPGINVKGNINQTYQHKFSQTTTAEIRMHCNGSNMRFINH